MRSSAASSNFQDEPLHIGRRIADPRFTAKIDVRKQVQRPRRAGFSQRVSRLEKEIGRAHV
jgi:hypothetical protein